MIDRAGSPCHQPLTSRLPSPLLPLTSLVNKQIQTDSCNTQPVVIPTSSNSKSNHVERNAYLWPRLSFVYSWRPCCSTKLMNHYHGVSLALRIAARTHFAYLLTYLFYVFCCVHFVCLLYGLKVEPMLWP